MKARTFFRHLGIFLCAFHGWALYSVVFKAPSPSKALPAETPQAQGSTQPSPSLAQQRVPDPYLLPRHYPASDLSHQALMALLEAAASAHAKNQSLMLRKPHQGIQKTTHSMGKATKERPKRS
jgi:hypothetical protein